MVSENKKNSIKLHHFGEELITAMINDLGSKVFYSFMEAKSFCPGQDKNDWQKKIEILKSIGISKQPAKSMLKMKLKKKAWLTDTEHDIDVAVMGKKDECFPIEVKMGISGSVSSWSTFHAYMINSPMKKRFLGEYIYIDGAMSSFLAGHKKKGLKGKIVESPIMPVWGLCIRKSNRKNFDKKTPKSQIKNLPLVFTFEELVEEYNTKKRSKKAYVVLVRKILNEASSLLNNEIAKALSNG